MLLGHVSFTHGRESYTDLCIVPIEESCYVEPTRVRLLKPTGSGIYHIGPKEGIIVMQGDEPNSIIVEVLKPAPLFLTPDTPTQPGFRVAKVKFVQQGDDFRTYYIAKDTIGAQWKEWVANRVRSE